VVASVSLVVGGIGIMNMMLTNVTERIREIGLRKALGARRSDITRQFMLESVCLCLAGGLIGVVLGYLGAFALTGLASGALVGEGMSVTPYIDGGTVLMATTICVVTGVVFGWYPARRAARLDPVESLHYQ
jgi:putative ABC transport system permease protein